MKGKPRKQKPVKHKIKHLAVTVQPETLDIDALFAAVHSPPPPKKGKRRKQGEALAAAYEADNDFDPRRADLIRNIRKLYADEGYAWLNDENPPEKYTTEQLEIHWKNLQAGKRAWKFEYTRSSSVLGFLEQIKKSGREGVR